MVFSENRPYVQRPHEAPPLRPEHPDGVDAVRP